MTEKMKMNYRLFLLFFISIFIDVARSDTQLKPIVILMEQGLKNLASQSCFKNWTRQLRNEGYSPVVEWIGEDEEKLNVYLDRINSQSFEPVGTILIGNIDLPEVKAQVFSYETNEEGQKKIPVTESVETMIPLMNPDVLFPEDGIVSNLNLFFDTGYFQNLDKFAGVISDGTDLSVEDRIKKYCDYFQRNLEYRNCSNRESNLDIVVYVDPDFKKSNAITDYLGQTNAWKCLSDACFVADSVTDLIELNSYSTELKPTYEFCHIDAHGTTEGLIFKEGEESFLFSGSDIATNFPNAKFYGFWACNAGSCKNGQNVSQSLLLSDSATLGIFANTRPVLWVDPKTLYKQIINGEKIGDALLEVYKSNLSPVNQRLNLSDFSGLIFYGDPTLKVHGCGI